MEKAYKFRIYPNKEQEILIQKTFGCSRFVFNRYLAKRRESYKESKESISLNTLYLDLTQIKKEFEWLKEVDSTALQASVKDLDTAYQNFFRRVKKGEKPGFPKFKKAFQAQGNQPWLLTRFMPKGSGVMWSPSRLMRGSSSGL